MRDDDFQVCGGGGYRAAREDPPERIMQDLRRNWSRHPELRAQYGGSFERYLVSERHNTTFGAR